MLKPMLLNMKTFWILLTVLQVLIFTSCTKSEMSYTPKPFDTKFELKLGNKIINAQIAITQTQKNRGLMYRESLPKNDAMIFVFETPKKMAFWMKNTEIPLDIAFLTKDGKITEIKKMYPHDLNATESHRSDILYCIETNINWFSQNNVSVGDYLDMQAFNKALAERKAFK